MKGEPAMAFKDLREWIDKLEAEGELKRIKAEVDWDQEIGGILRKIHAERGPAVLFENIKEYGNTPSRKLFAAGLSSRKRIALLLGLRKETSYREMVELLRKRFNERIKPVVVKNGPIKENIVKGGDVDIFKFPVPKWHPFDGGRYINTYCGVVTRDPDTGEYNVGLYRGMIISKDKIGVLLVPSQHWGIHYKKYQRLGKAMPVAIVIGTDDLLPFVASTPILPSEYEVIGAIRQEPLELVKCETVDLEVPAHAEIVIEGSISHDPNTYEIEGPFGEFPGFYGEARKRPVIAISCVTHRNDCILRGSLEGMDLGAVNETASTGFVAYSALMRNILDSQGIPGVIDLIPFPWAIVKIHKTYQGQARHLAAALWGSRLTIYTPKTIMVVEEDVDIYNLRDVQLAIERKVNFDKDLVIYPMLSGSPLDPSLAPESRDELEFGTGLQKKLLIDATTDWETHRIRKEWGNKRFPRSSIELTPEIQKLVERRWKEYGF
jgi:UbiD family decarboxylase